MWVRHFQENQGVQKGDDGKNHDRPGERFCCGADTRNLGDLYAESGQTLQGSLTAVSKPNFATKYALESSRRDLQNALLCTGLVYKLKILFKNR